MSALLPLTPPGEILAEEFLKPLGITEYRLAKDIGVPARRINEIVHGTRAISVDTAWRFGRYFGTTPQFWLNLQSSFALRSLEREGNLPAIVPHRVSSGISDVPAPEITITACSTFDELAHITRPEKARRKVSTKKTRVKRPLRKAVA